MTAISEIVRFQTDRGLDKKKYNGNNEHINIVEELLESMGIDTPKDRRKNLSSDWLEFLSKRIVKTPIVQAIDNNEKVDAYCDIIVFAIGALLKLGYDPEKALVETAKEINSRQGEMVNGKFEKFLSPAMKALWYKANYDICKR